MCDEVEPAVYTAEQVAVILQIAVTTVYELADRGQIPECPRLGRRRLRRFPRAAIDAIAAGKKPDVKEAG